MDGVTFGRVLQNVQQRRVGKPPGEEAPALPVLSKQLQAIFQRNAQDEQQLC
jgi:hypothetical protein